MSWIHLIFVSILLQSVLINHTNAGLIRRRRQQTSGSLYGNSNPAGANPSAGYNYPANTNLYGTNLNNQASKDLYGNPLVPSNTGNSFNMGLTNQQQQQQQQQMYGANIQPLANPSYTGTGLYSPTGMNQGTGNTGMRDNNGNLSPAGSSGSSLYSPTNSQIGYPSNANQGLYNKDAYNPVSNTNNNQYGLNNNPYPNSNTYVKQQLPNNNNNQWQNTNYNNQYPSNPGNTWSQNRDSNTNNNNNAYSNPNPNSNSNSPYLYNSAADQMMVSCLMIFLCIFARIFFHI